MSRNLFFRFIGMIADSSLGYAWVYGICGISMIAAAAVMQGTTLLKIIDKRSKFSNRQKSVDSTKPSSSTSH